MTLVSCWVLDLPSLFARPKLSTLDPDGMPSGQLPVCCPSTTTPCSHTGAGRRGCHNLRRLLWPVGGTSRGRMGTRKSSGSWLSWYSSSTTAVAELPPTRAATECGQPEKSHTPRKHVAAAVRHLHVHLSPQHHKGMGLRNSVGMHQPPSRH
jgi:hypothetical protein